MFTGQSEDNKPKRLVGAKEKREQAKQFNSNFKVQSKREGQEAGPTIPLIIIYGLSVALAFLLSEGPMKSQIGFSSGSEGFDRIFFGPGYPSFTTGADTNRLIAVLLRGGLFFALAGLLPLITYLWQQLLDRARMNLYLAFWGTTVTVALLYYLLKDMIGPLLSNILSIIF